MDSTSNGRRNTRSRPSFTNLNFASQTRGNRFQNEMEDNLPPGTIPTNLSLGQFSPYSGQMMISSNFSSSGPSSHNIASPNPIFQRTPSVPSQGVNSRRLLSSHPSFGSTQITTEHLLNTYSQESVGKLKIDPLGEAFDFVASDLQDHGEIGRGAFGAVSRMVHIKSRTEMAVKRIRSTVDEKEQKQLLMDLEVVMRSSDCQYIVKFYGALFWEGDCWICMELMSTSLDKFYRFVYHRQHGRIPEDILGKIAMATVKALDYLKEKLQIMHRDVKPSNILIDRGGNIKLCDFGISGQLVNSIAKTRDAGCRPYMAPERIDTSRSGNGYDVRSDVWSLGITLIELSTGKFPYPKWTNVFDQLTQVVKGEPPKLRNDPPRLTFSDSYANFVNMLTIAEAELRPKYAKLLATPYLTNMAARPVDVASYFCTVLNSMTEADFMGDSNSDDAFRP